MATGWFQQAYPGSDREQHWFIVRTQEQFDQLQQPPWDSFRSRVLFADRLPPGHQHPDIQAITLEDHLAPDPAQPRQLPAGFHQWPQVSYLRIPQLAMSPSWPQMPCRRS